MEDIDNYNKMIDLLMQDASSKDLGLVADMTEVDPDQKTKKKKTRPKKSESQIFDIHKNKKLKS